MYLILNIENYRYEFVCILCFERWCFIIIFKYLGYEFVLYIELIIFLNRLIV